MVGVIDGDSIRVMHDGQAEQIRLIGIDCPEKRQPFGTRAKEYASELAFGQDVTVYGGKRDRYGRTLAEVLLPDGRSLNQARLGELERQARVTQKGFGSNQIQCRRGSGGKLEHHAETSLPARLN